jgi:hypothetical protein
MENNIHLELDRQQTNDDTVSGKIILKSNEFPLDWSISPAHCYLGLDRMIILSNKNNSSWWMLKEMLNQIKHGTIPETISNSFIRSQFIGSEVLNLQKVVLPLNDDIEKNFYIDGQKIFSFKFKQATKSEELIVYETFTEYPMFFPISSKFIDIIDAIYSKLGKEIISTSSII